MLDGSSLAGYAVGPGASIEGGDVHHNHQTTQRRGGWADGRAEPAAPAGMVAWSAVNLDGMGDAQTDQRDQAGRAALPSSPAPLGHVAAPPLPSAFLPPSRPGLARASSSPSPYLSVPSVSATTPADPAHPLPQAWSTASRLPPRPATSSFSALAQHPTSVPLETTPPRAPIYEGYRLHSDASRPQPPVTSQPPIIPPSSRWQRHSLSGPAPAAALPTWADPTPSLAPAEATQRQFAPHPMWNSTLHGTADWGAASAQSQATNRWLGRQQTGTNDLLPSTSSSSSTSVHAPAPAIGRLAVVVPSVPSSLSDSTMSTSPYDYSPSPLSVSSNSPSSTSSFPLHPHSNSFERRRASVAYLPTVPPLARTQSSSSDTLSLTSSSLNLYSINPSTTIVHPVASTSTAELAALLSLHLPSRHTPFSAAPRPPISVITSGINGKGKVSSVPRSNPSSTSVSSTSLELPSATASFSASCSPSMSTSPTSASNWADGDVDLSDPDDYYPLPSVPLPPGAKPKKPRKKRRKLGEPPRDLAQRKYACELCVEEPKSFARPSALKIHMLTHTKEKPHVCPDCSRGFAIIANLKRHQKLHEKEEESGVEPVASTQSHEGGTMVGGGGGGQGNNLTWVPLAGARRRGGDEEQDEEYEEEWSVDEGRLEQ
ncbi:hypothetical protein JCM1840_006493 [Sporobolomyces johnsonii]